MGKKLGAALIIYGMINLFASVVMLFTFNAMLTIIGVAGIVWSIIFIAIGWWSRERAIAQEHRDEQLEEQTELLRKLADKQDLEKDRV